MWAVCIFCIKPCLSHHLQILSPSRLLFVLLMVFFDMQKLVSLTRFHLFIFVFISVALGDRPEKIWFMSEHHWPIFFSRSSMGSCLIFKFLNHFEFIFVYGERFCSYFIGIHVSVQLSQHHLLKRLSFIHCTFWPPLSKI